MNPTNKITNIVRPAVVLLALSLISVPAFAQQRRGQEDRGRAQAARVAPRGNEDRAHSAPAEHVAPRGNEDRAHSAPAERVAPRGNDDRAHSAPAERVAPRGNAQAVPRQAVPRGNVVGPRAYPPTAEQRPYAVPRPAYRSYSTPRYAYRPFFSRPYYAFRPRVSIGFGLWIGYPVVFPVVPYGYAYPADGYPPPAVDVTPGYAADGGLSFDIDPPDAAVYVDGQYMGTAGDFGPSMQPLAMAPGQHRVEVQADGYQGVVYDVDVPQGEVIPFRGTLQELPY